MFHRFFIAAFCLIITRSLGGSNVKKSEKDREHKISLGSPYYPQVYKNRDDSHKVIYNLQVKPPFRPGVKMLDFYRTPPENSLKMGDPPKNFKSCQPCDPTNCPVTSNTCASQFDSSITDRVTIELSNLRSDNKQFWEGQWKFSIIDYHGSNEIAIFYFTLHEFLTESDPHSLQSVGYIYIDASSAKRMTCLLLIGCLLISKFDDMGLSIADFGVLINGCALVIAFCAGAVSATGDNFKLTIACFVIVGCPALLGVYVLLRHRLTRAYKENPNHLYIYVALLAIVALGVTSTAGIFAALAHNDKEHVFPVDGKRIIVLPCVGSILLCLLNGTLFSYAFSDVTKEKMF